MEPGILGVPLGWVPSAAGPVWLMLTGLMAAGAWLLARSGTAASRSHARLVLGLTGLCWFHPLYTWLAARVGYELPAGLAASIITLFAALRVVGRISRSSARAAALRRRRCPMPS